jgi:hypothetical protein
MPELDRRPEMGDGQQVPSLMAFWLLPYSSPNVPIRVFAGFHAAIHSTGGVTRLLDMIDAKAVENRPDV